MKNILIINLKRYGDILSTAHLIGPLIKKHPKVRISILVYKEFKKAAEVLNHVENIYTINRKEILTLKKNEMFSDAYAMEELFNNLKPVKRMIWDQVINYSNDMVGSYLTSYLLFDDKDDANKYAGIKFSDKHSITQSNNWVSVFNDILTTYKHTPFHFMDCYNNMLDLLWHEPNKILKTNEKYDKTVKEKLSEIKQGESCDGEDVKIVGIQLLSSVPEKDIPFLIMIDLINDILDDSELYPVLLIAPFKKEKEYAQKINKHFDNDLIIIEADLLAAVSVIDNLDILITPDTVIKHMADLTKTKTIEISLGPSPFLKQGSTNQESIILTPSLKLRNFEYNNGPPVKVNSEKKSITANDIIQAIKCLINSNYDTLTRLSPDVSMYRIKRDLYGINYYHIAGSLEPETEISRSMSRILIHKLFDPDKEITIDEKILSIPYDDIMKWIKKEKDAIILSSKNILSTLKFFLQKRSNNIIKSDFVKSLEKLLQEGKSNNLISIPIILFQTNIDSISPGKSMGENIKEVENLLYKLKDDIQIILKCLKGLEISCHVIKNEKLIDKMNSKIITEKTHTLDL